MPPDRPTKARQTRRHPITWCGGSPGGRDALIVAVGLPPLGPVGHALRAGTRCSGPPRLPCDGAPAPGTVSPVEGPRFDRTQGVNAMTTHHRRTRRPATRLPGSRRCPAGPSGRPAGGDDVRRNSTTPAPSWWSTGWTHETGRCAACAADCPCPPRWTPGGSWPRPGPGTRCRSPAPPARRQTRHPPRPRAGGSPGWSGACPGRRRPSDRAGPGRAARPGRRRTAVGVAGGRGLGGGDQ